MLRSHELLTLVNFLFKQILLGYLFQVHRFHGCFHTLDDARHAVGDLPRRDGLLHPLRHGVDA